MNKLKPVFLFCVIAFSLQLNFTTRAQGIRFERIGMEEGLSFTGVRGVAQDSLGFLWISTTRGLNRYDGYSFKTYWHSPDDSSSISDDRTYEMIVDSKGNLWIASNKGLNRYNRETDSFTRFQHIPDDSTSLSDNRINTLFEDSKGRLWIGTVAGGLNLFDPITETFTQFYHDPDNPGSLSSNQISAVYEDPAGNLWIGTYNGLNKFEPETQASERFYLHDDPQHLHNWVKALLVDSYGNFWVGVAGEDGIHTFDRESKTFKQYIYDATQPTALGQPPPLQREGRFIPFLYSVNTILQDRMGFVWFGTLQGGIVRYDPRTEVMEHYAFDPENQYSPSGDWPWQIFEDGTGTIWIASSQRGISKVVYIKFEQIQNETSRKDNNILSIYEGAETVWAGTSGGLSKIDNAGHLRPVLQEDGTPVITKEVTAVLEDHVGQIWAGTNTHLVRYDPGSKQKSTFRFEHENTDTTSLRVLNTSIGKIKALHQDSSGSLWLGTSIGLYFYDNLLEDFTRFPPPDSMSFDTNIRAFALDKSNQLRVISTNSLRQLDTNAKEWGTRYYVHPFTNAAIQDQSQRLWIGNYPAGILLIDEDDGALKPFQVNNRPIAGEVLGMIEDEDGMLWISDHSALTRFDPYNNTVTRFTAEDGIPTGGFNALSYHRGESRKLYFGSSQGITTFSPGDLHTTSNPPRLAFTNLLVNNEPVSIDQRGPLTTDISAASNIHLQHNQNDFSISFSALDFNKPQNNLYEYKLEGYDEDWLGPTAVQQATYTNIDPGKYTFLVKGANAEGIWNEEGISISISIDKPWWSTNKALLLYGLSLLSLVWYANVLQRNRLKLKERQQAQIREAEFKANAAAERARMAEHLEGVKSRFFINLSHEFRTPLTLILGPLHDALEGMYGSVESRFRNQLASMHRNGDRLHNLINQLLDLAKIEAGSFNLQARESDLVLFARAITLSFTSRAERERKVFTFQTAESPIPVYFDREKLEKVLVNLLSNAFKFTDTNDQINVELGSNEREAWIKVQDTGKGIPATELKKIFDRFHQVETTLSREHEGSGIGLSLAKELVELHKGRIEVESNEGKGSIFTVCLPLGMAHLQEEDIVVIEEEELALSVNKEEFPTPEAGTISQEQPIEVNEKRSTTILIVEDHVDVRNYIKSHLGRHHIEEAVNGEEGLKKAATLKPDLVISDIMMPKMDGLALCDALKRNKKTQDIPVILLTAKAAEEDKIEGLQTGADDYLYKPFSARELLVRVENLISQRRRLQKQYRSEVVLNPAEIVVSSEDAVFMEKVSAIVEEHIGDSQFGAERLADEVGMSRRQLQRRLNSVVNMSPSAFIRDIRLERASHLLEQKSGNISQIAFAVGYRDPRHFTKVFKEKYGIPPSMQISKNNESAG